MHHLMFLALLYYIRLILAVSQQDISYHIRQIHEEDEQMLERTHKTFLLVRRHYNLDMIIAAAIV